MFKKNEIKKALTALCLHNDISEALLTLKGDAEQTDTHFLKGYAVKLYTDELMEYLNDESVAELRDFETFDRDNLGLLGKCPLVSTYINENVYGKNERQERVCCVGRSVVKPYHSSITEDGSEFVTLVEDVTYITENGDLLLVRETSYIANKVPLLITRTVDDKITPSVANIAEFLPEEFWTLWHREVYQKVDMSALTDSVKDIAAGADTHEETEAETEAPANAE